MVGEIRIDVEATLRRDNAINEAIRTLNELTGSTLVTGVGHKSMQCPECNQRTPCTSLARATSRVKSQDVTVWECDFCGYVLATYVHHIL